MKLSQAREEDLDDIVALVNSAYRGEVSRTGWTTEAEFLEGQRIDAVLLREDLKNGDILIYRESHQLQACLFVSFPDAKKRCYFGMISVHPHIQAKGLGRKLLAAAEDYACAKGATSAQMGVIHLRRSLIEWYQRRGYQLTGESKPFPYGDERFGIPLRDDLRFVILEKTLR